MHATRDIVAGIFGAGVTVVAIQGLPVTAASRQTDILGAGEAIITGRIVLTAIHAVTDIDRARNPVVAVVQRIDAVSLRVTEVFRARVVIAAIDRWVLACAALVA